VLKFDCCSIFKALSDQTRVKILLLLHGKEMCVTEICSHFNMKQPSISHHLSILKNNGLVSDRKDGKEIYYSLNKQAIVTSCCSFMGNFENSIPPKEK
jgi:ArsR family transcriptional regulator, arsenate/arsenite/antimonite-responsive transcriptional repressor